VPVADVTNVTIWGNHSATQFPDARNAKIAGKPAYDAIKDHAWLQGDFISTVQKRGAAIIDARGLSSAASAANAIVDSVVSIRTATAPNDWTSLAVVSKGEYGIPEGLQFGFPIKTDGNKWEVVQNLPVDEFAKGKIKITTDELVGERSEVAELIK
jgi:malate dehydrogenase